ncbi:MAG: hypothetical protein IH888_11625 [Planctomycetes bacterium]|nr:hypothetical protein [Planctomycetota bacterium]
MNEIRSLLRMAARRLEMGALLRKSHVVAAVLGVVVVLALVAERLGAVTFVPWAWVLPVLLGVAAFVAWRWWVADRCSELQVAVEVDGRLDLREKLSTALHCRNRSDSFARAAIEDAVHTARNRKVKELLRRRFEVGSPPRWWITPGLVVLAVAISFIDPLDLFTRDASADPEVAKTLKERDEAIKAVIDPIRKSPELLKELADLLDELESKEVHPDAFTSRRDIKRDAIKKLSDLNKRLDEIINGPQGKTMEAIKRGLKQLRSPKDGPAKELANALARGDFKAAQQALAKLKADAENPTLTEEQRRRLARQLRDLAQQLEQLAKQQQKLEDLLKQLGLDPKLATNPQALKQAIQNNPNLNEQQRLQLQQMAQGQQAAGRMMQGLAGALGGMAGQLAAGGFADAAGQFSNQLSELEMLQQLLMQAQAAAGACQGQFQGIGQGLGMQSALQLWMQSRGGAFGGAGRGVGGKAPISPTPTRTRLTKANTKTTPGDIIARQFIEGPQVVGESKARLRQVAAAVARGFDEALGEDQLPRKYHDAHMHYFGELTKRVEVIKPAGGDEPDTAAPTDEETESGD